MVSTELTFERQEPGDGREGDHQVLSPEGPTAGFLTTQTNAAC